MAITNILTTADQCFSGNSESFTISQNSGNDRTLILIFYQRATSGLDISSPQFDGTAPSQTIVTANDGFYHTVSYRWNDAALPATSGSYNFTWTGEWFETARVSFYCTGALQTDITQTDSSTFFLGLAPTFTVDSGDVAITGAFQNAAAVWTHQAGATIFTGANTTGDGNFDPSVDTWSRRYGASYELGETNPQITSSTNNSSILQAFVLEESASDTTAPVLTSPTAGSLTTDGVTPSVTTDEGNGTLYWGIYADAASPTAAQVVAGTSAILSGSQAVSGTGSQGVSAQTGLDDATSYELFFVHDDAAANRSNLSTVGFTTSTDSTAPSLTSPTAGSVTSTSVNPTVTTDTAEGTAYARVYADGATPTASQVQSGTGVTPVGSATNITVGASGALNFSAITGLTEGVDYELYFVHEDAATTPNLSAVSTVGFTTTAAARSVALTGANGYELRDETGAVIASLNGIVWEWYDDPDSTTGTPTDSGTFNTSAGGEATITITGSSLADGAFGTLWVRHPTDDEIRGNYYLPITVS